MSENNFSQFLEAMAEPFSVMSVEWKPGATTQDKSKALALAYVESRVYIARLNELAGGEWSDEYQVITLPDRVAVICKLTIFGVTRTGDGEALFGTGDDERVDPNLVTSASAQAFKRACVKFGLGAYLYDLPQVWCDYDAKARRIVNPPKLPDWAVPFGERDAYKASHGGNGNGNGAKAPTPVPAVNPAPKATAPAPAVVTPTPAPAPTPTPSAVATAIPAANPANVIVHFGRYNGKTLAEIKALGKEGKGWLEWCANTFQPKSDSDATLKKAVKAFLLSASGADEEDVPF